MPVGQFASEPIAASTARTIFPLRYFDRYDGEKGSLLLFLFVPKPGSGVHLLCARDKLAPRKGLVLVPGFYKVEVSNDRVRWSEVKQIGMETMENAYLETYSLLANGPKRGITHTVMIGIPLDEVLPWHLPQENTDINKVFLRFSIQVFSFGEDGEMQSSIIISEPVEFAGRADGTTPGNVKSAP